MAEEAYRTQARAKHRNAFDMERSALLVIDMQEYFLNEKSHAFVPAGKNVTGNVARLLTVYRARGLTVIFTYFAVADGEDDPIARWWRDTVHEGTEQAAVVRELEPKENELVLRKPTYDAFHRTNLDEILRQRNVRQLIITGVLTNLCVETTARAAFCRGFDVFVVTDATAAYEEEMHRASLKNLAYGFATPLCVREVLERCTDVSC